MTSDIENRYLIIIHLNSMDFRPVDISSFEDCVHETLS